MPFYWVNTVPVFIKAVVSLVQEYLATRTEIALAVLVQPSFQISDGIKVEERDRECFKLTWV